MTEDRTNSLNSGGCGAVKTVLFSLPMAALTGFILWDESVSAGGAGLASFLAVWSVFNFGFARILKTGRIDRWRAGFFTAVSFLFTVYIMSYFAGAGDAPDFAVYREFREADPMCHLIVPFLIAPLALSREIIYPGAVGGGSLGSVIFMFAVWITAALTLGKGFCSWGCFFGGFNEFFSRLLKKPKIRNIPGHFVYFPFAVLILFILLSLVYLAPVYCDALCPFKAVFEPARLFSGDAFLIAVSVLLFIALAVVLPVLTGKKTLCAFSCPFGAFLSAADAVSPFEVKVDLEKCLEWGDCVKDCPMMAMTEESRKKGRASRLCSKCGKCVDNCPNGAIYFHVKRTSKGSGRNFSRLLFLYASFLFLAAFGGKIAMNAVELITLFLAG